MHPFRVSNVQQGDYTMYVKFTTTVCEATGVVELVSIERFNGDLEAELQYSYDDNNLELTVQVNTGTCLCFDNNGDEGALLQIVTCLVIDDVENIVCTELSPELTVLQADDCEFYIVA